MIILVYIFIMLSLFLRYIYLQSALINFTFYFLHLIYIQAYIISTDIYQKAQLRYLKMLKRIPKINLLCQSQKLPQNIYLDLAIKQIQKLSQIAQQNIDEQKADFSSTDKILKINSKTNSIVINTQTPNRQLWYSSTTSGPQRFDYDGKKLIWVNVQGKNIQEVFLNDLRLIG